MFDVTLLILLGLAALGLSVITPLSPFQFWC
ncbi:Uncharacterised protein [Escherichia coli]|uniref:Uncharacterized protein n=1 Tax=Escherichia coli TaxID=562 RepID=A0A376VHL9_ECOLX|nr:Uncharacterised protein [Escherichia coli]